MLEAPRGLSHPQTSFIGTVCQGIHHTPFRAAHAPKNPNDSFKRQTTNHHTVKMITKRSISKPDSSKKEEPGEIAIKQAGQKILHCSRPLSSSQTTTHPDRTRPAARKADGVPPGASGKPHAPKTDAGGGPGTQKHTHTTPRRPQGPAKPTISSTPARPHEPGNHPRRMGHTTDARPAS